MIKRSLNGPKTGDVHYASDRSSSIEIYSEGRCEKYHDMEIRSHDYAMPSSSSSSMAVHGSPMNVATPTPTPSDDMWNMQYLSNEAFSFNNSTAHPIPNYGTLPYPPSKVMSTCRLILLVNLSFQLDVINYNEYHQILGQDNNI